MMTYTNAKDILVNVFVVLAEFAFFPLAFPLRSESIEMKDKEEEEEGITAGNSYAVNANVLSPSYFCNLL